MLTFMVPLCETPSTRAFQRHLASLPCRDLASNLTKLQIRQQERSYSRHLKCWNRDYRAFISQLGMLTVQCHLLSKPVDPKYIIEICRQKYIVFFSVASFCLFFFVVVSSSVESSTAQGFIALGFSQHPLLVVRYFSEAVVCQIACAGTYGVHLGYVLSSSH